MKEGRSGTISSPTLSALEGEFVLVNTLPQRELDDWFLLAFIHQFFLDPSSSILPFSSGRSVSRQIQHRLWMNGRLLNQQTPTLFRLELYSNRELYRLYLL